MLVDHERLLLALKAEIAAKPSHGGRDLLARISALEAEHAIQPDEYERMVRLFSHHLEDSFMGLVPRADEDDDPPASAAASAPAVARPPHLRRSPTTEATCQSKSSRPPSRSQPRAA